MKACFSLLVLASLSAGGCVRTYYDWRNYERSILRMYKEPEDFDLAEEIEILAKDVEKTNRKGRRVPPGVMAHLGYLYYLAGDDRAAEAHFRTERELFSESEILMDTLVARMR